MLICNQKKSNLITSAEPLLAERFMLGGGDKQQERCVEDAGRDVHEDPAAKPRLLTSPDLLGWVTLYVMPWLMI